MIKSILNSSFPFTKRWATPLRFLSRRVAGGRVSPKKCVPASVLRPPYVLRNDRPFQHDSPFVVKKSPWIQQAMRRTGKLARRVLELAGSLVRPGMTTDAIDATLHDFILSEGAYPSPLGYGGFPKSIATSVNNVVCHGIPDDEPLQEGDVINIDITVFREGVHGDTSATFCVGEVAPEHQRLVETCQQALKKGIDVCGPGVPIHAIGDAIEAFVGGRYGIVREFVGHGIGEGFHELPYVFHFSNDFGAPMVGCDVLQPGMALTIEPVLVMGSADTKTLDDGWTVVTKDGKWTAQFEHTLLVTENGVDVLTGPDVVSY